MKQIDQVNCDTCGELGGSTDVTDRRYRSELARASAHARKFKHNVHVLMSDSVHYLHAPADNDGGPDA